MPEGWKGPYFAMTPQPATSGQTHWTAHLSNHPPRCSPRPPLEIQAKTSFGQHGRHLHVQGHQRPFSCCPFQSQSLLCTIVCASMEGHLKRLPVFALTQPVKCCQSQHRSHQLRRGGCPLGLTTAFEKVRGISWINTQREPSPGLELPASKNDQPVTAFCVCPKLIPHMFNGSPCGNHECLRPQLQKYVPQRHNNCFREPTHCAPGNH